MNEISIETIEDERERKKFQTCSEVTRLSSTAALTNLI